MTRIRGFEIVSKYRDENITLPRRQTIASAGYDLAAAVDMEIPSIWRLNFVRIFRIIRNGHQLYESDYQQAEAILKPFLVPTGVKAYMPEDEVLILANRSSNTFRRNLSLPNGIGVVDADYYNNPDNEGELFAQLLNYGVRTIKIHQGDRIAQGIFVQYRKTDDDQPVSRERLSGFGSTNKKES
ncbi:dUTP diphosphatase [Lactobacillus xylocopicola]|uniref:dUTP diphosphatase n=1 Tax=Lactobacillus xylocopicola TaxID=2976676 RepID=A0ABM8BHU1_9LACO|nr:dUTP diphosphatase [Lactobacillus xylocopicola]BDR60843.1 dUTP diphosphatase [Lactobacillus xylocopicola]